MKKNKENKQTPFEIGGDLVQPGTAKIVHIPFSFLPTQRSFDLNLRVVHGRQQGKCLLISSTIHGDELNGIEVIRRVLSSPLTKHIRGTLIAIPIVNILGVLTESRYLPDRRDLNRSFPGSEKGSAASQLANIFLTEIVQKCSHCIDLHTGSNNRINLPQIRCNFQNDSALKMAFAFGAPVTLKAPNRDGSLREAAEEMGIHSLTFEGGEALRFNEFSIRAAVQGIFRVMGVLGMISPKKCPALKGSSVISPTSRWLRSPSTGIFRTNGHLGKKVLKGDVIGKISDPIGTTTLDIVATFEGIIIGLNQSPLVYKGDALFHIAWVPDPSRAEATIEEFGEETDLNLSLNDPSTY
ncbi:MAG: succinylglutamate desuccinylase/aspartoacylase family protein [Alphaproteobacteria bacterium]|nr:succinylglutamate desuccinylase/aspartoacylase family protein [Alphaproteobacteria bacterium]